MDFGFPISQRLIIFFLLALSLTLISPPASAQFLPTGGGSGDTARVTTPWWDINKARRCGRLWCSDVFLRGSSQVTLTVGLIPGEEETSLDAANAVQSRAQQVESIFNSIYFTLVSLDSVEVPPKNVPFLRSKVFDLNESSLNSYPNPLSLPQPTPEIKPPSSPPPVNNGNHSNGEGHTSIERRTPTTSLKHVPQNAIRIISPPAGASPDFPEDEIHPLTPRVEVGIQNNQMVVFIPNQEELRLAQQTIVTVNQADEIVNGKSVDVLAYEWRNRIQDSFDKALWGHELDRQYPWDRYQISGFFVIMAMVVVAMIGFIRSFLRRRDLLLRQQLKSLAQAITRDVEAETAESVRIANEQHNQAHEKDSNIRIVEERSLESKKKSSWFGRKKMGQASFSDELKDRVNDVWQNIGDLASVNLRRQTMLKQRRNFSVLISWILFWLQVSCIFTVGAFIVYIFPGTRPYTLLFIGQAMYFPLLWIGITLIDKFSGIFVDGFLNNWAKEQQQYKGESNRYTLRVMTYSPAIRGGLSVVLTLLGILGTIWLFGINPLVLASFGGVAFVLAFLGRNVVEDMLNGTLILWTDRYAIGDVVQIGDVFGLVENMNIYITQLRGPEGRLSTIPNGQIFVVQNLTKDWSRVEFIVEIDQSSDIEKALDVIKIVCKQMREDPLWEDKILEPAAILGVDNIASRGIQLQVWIKTQAGQHWPVGREFRLRMKKAFELAGINLGAPHQRIIYQNSSQYSTRNR